MKVWFVSSRTWYFDDEKLEETRYDGEYDSKLFTSEEAAKAEQIRLYDESLRNAVTDFNQKVKSYEDHWKAVEALREAGIDPATVLGGYWDRETRPEFHPPEMRRVFYLAVED